MPCYSNICNFRVDVCMVTWRVGRTVGSSASVISRANSTRADAAVAANAAAAALKLAAEPAARPSRSNEGEAAATLAKYSEKHLCAPRPERQC